MRRTTSADVAMRAGVSRATVSYVLNGSTTAIRISSDTRERVLRAAAELGYAPNHAAQALRKNRTGILAYVHAGRRSYFFFHVMTGVQLAAEERGFVFASFTLDTPKALQAVTTFLGGRGADAVITPESEGPVYDALAVLARQGLPVVTMGANGQADMPAVGFDLEEGGFLATSHLIALGHERIAHIESDASASARPDASPDRHDGYLRALTTAGIEPRPEWHVVESGTPEGGARAIHRLLALPPPRPTAVFAHTDWMALGVLQELHAASVPVPDEMAVVGFDGLDIAAVAVPPLTTVELPCKEFGRQAVAIVADRLEGRPGASPQLLPPRVIERHSSVPQAGGSRSPDRGNPVSVRPDT